MKWKCSLHYWHSRKLLNKQLMFRWFEKPWRSYDVNVMYIITIAVGIIAITTTSSVAIDILWTAFQRKFHVKAKLVFMDFITWLLTWLLCCQPVRNQVWSFLSTNIDFDMENSLESVPTPHEQTANFEEIGPENDLANFPKAHFANPYSVNMTNRVASGGAKNQDYPYLHWAERC